MRGGMGGEPSFAETRASASLCQSGHSCSIRKPSASRTQPRTSRRPQVELEPPRSPPFIRGGYAGLPASVVLADPIASAAGGVTEGAWLPPSSTFLRSAPGAAGDLGGWGGRAPVGDAEPGCWRCRSLSRNKAAMRATNLPKANGILISSSPAASNLAPLCPSHQRQDASADALLAELTADPRGPPCWEACGRGSSAASCAFFEREAARADVGDVEDVAFGAGSIAAALTPITSRLLIEVVRVVRIVDCPWHRSLPLWSGSVHPARHGPSAGNQRADRASRLRSATPPSARFKSSLSPLFLPLPPRQAASRRSTRLLIPHEPTWTRVDTAEASISALRSRAGGAQRGQTRPNRPHRSSRYSKG